MNYDDEITQEEFDRLTQDCKVNEVPKSSFQIKRDSSTEEFISIIDEFAGLLHTSRGKAVTVCRFVGDLNSTLIQDWLERLGDSRIEGRSSSKVEVRVFDEFLAVSNTSRAEGCTRRQHNQNIMMNIEHILEDNYLKEKQYEQR